MIRSQVACLSCSARERDASRWAGNSSLAVQSPAVQSPTVQSRAPNAPSTSVPAEEPSQGTGFPLALLYGTVAALVGIAVYAAFTIITHFYIGYMAVVVGLMVGAAMMKGSGGVGGLEYQMTAVALTYAAITLAYFPIHIASLASEGTVFDWATMSGPLLFDAIARPFLRLQTGAHGIIGLVILFAGLRVAFQVTKEKPQKAAPVTL